MTIPKMAWLVILLPLLGALVNTVLALAQVRRAAHWIAILTVGSASAVSIYILHTFIRQPDLKFFGAGFPWFNLGITWAVFDTRIDSLTAIMLAVVTVVSLLVIFYSRGYMADDPSFPRFFAQMSLFVAAMCTLVLAGNFLMLYLGWEGVGLCSYLLIGFWYRRPAAASAAVKAFVVTRIGDTGFALGVLMIFLTFGNVSYTEIFQRAPLLNPAMATLISLLLLSGAVGKSAQIPLYVWLPDAMEGPTPVSALIHAATMVTAGVYLIARCGALFTPASLDVVALIGALTAIYSASIALAQYDIKRILAYSTISQIGYMFLAMGVLAPQAGIFHLATHAFFKALLFLCAGAVMHSMAGVIDLRQIGGMKNKMPLTYWTFLIASLSLTGLMPFSGFYSKDQIITAAWQRWPLLGLLAILTAFLTAFYIFRVFFRTFHGPEKIPPYARVHSQTVGGWMYWPMIILAGFSIALGLTIGLPADHGAIHRILEPSLTWTQRWNLPQVEPKFSTLWIFTTVAELLGIALAWRIYRTGGDVFDWVGKSRLLRSVHALLNRKYYIDEVYDAAAAQPARLIAEGCSEADYYLIDGIIAVLVAVPQLLGRSLRALQQGTMQGYALGVLIVLALMLLFILKLSG